MKPEFMRLRRALAGTVAALLLAVGVVALSPALSASAHVPSVSANCTGGLTVDLKSYPGGTTIKVTVDGAVTHNVTLDEPWQGWFVNVPWVSTVNHTYQVDVDSSDGTYYDFKKDGEVTGCVPPDEPKLSASAYGCVTYGTTSGTVSYSLSGVKSSYTVELRQNGTVIQTTSRNAGSWQFTNVAPGTYTVRAWAPYHDVETSSFALAECTPNQPNIVLAVSPCVTGGALGAITATLSDLNTGVSYRLKLHSDDGTVLQTKDHQATSPSFSTSFDNQGPGTYYVTVAMGNGAVLKSSARATIQECTPTDTPKIAVQLLPCISPSNGLSGREISATISDLAPATVYTVQLVTADAAATVVASVVTPGNAATAFTHLFTGVPVGGDYVVTVNTLGAPAPLASNPVTAIICQLPDLAPPSIELVADQCDGSGTGIDALTARMIDLDVTKTYFVRIVDAAGATVPGGEDRTVSGSTTSTVEFPDVTTAGTYTAQLLINPGKQLAATSPAAVDFSVCLPTLAMTGPGVLVPLGSVAALLLTLGGAVVTGRLRRRMAL